MSVFGPFQSNSSRAICLLALFCLPGKGLLAAELSEFNGIFQIHGFLTQGYVKTTENSFFGESKDGSFDFNEIGINASYRLSPAMMASAQLLSRTAGEMYDGSLDLDFAQFDYAYQLNETSRIGFIIGRSKNPLGLYNDTRDVAATRPGIFMPQAIYWDRVRNMVLSNDGGQIYTEGQFANHFFNLQLFAGKTPIDENVEKSYLDPSLNPKMEQDGVTTGGRLLYEWDGGRIRLALSNASLTLDSQTSLIPPGSIDIDYWVLSAQYNDGPWSLTMEYMEEPIDYRGFGGFMDVADTTVDGYYLQGSYRLQADWEMFARFEESHYDKHDKNGKKSSARIGLPPHTFFSKLWTLGLLWEPTEQLMFRAEFSQVEGTIFLSNLENPLPNIKERDWNLFSLLVSYSF
ncbi:MAG: OprO/OprP family phosphate-selective porin [Candidatus Thiodiazotropha sp. (ex Lucinoma borealis)]|nr:OprO/OprP family phosphate-selective porin [Candidatus Thiodiazotropha sp. (ex Lucinoma borealis)]